MQVEGQHGGGLPPLMATGARVSNACPTCPAPGDNPAKAGLIPDGLVMVPAVTGKGSPVRDGGASH